jgi:glycyl-tRNA synthetase beta chain
VAAGIFTHYLPRHADDILPGDLVGALVGLADRLDTICGCFGVGLSPTGTADPYGLRRHVLAIIRILRAQGLHLDLPETVWLSLELLKEKLSRTPEETALEVLDFFQTRLQNLLQAEGLDQETVAAVLAAGSPDLVDAIDKVQALEEIRKSPDFPALAVAFKRVINISRGAEAGEVDELLFEYPEERLLWEATAVMEDEFEKCFARVGMMRVKKPGETIEPSEKVTAAKWKRDYSRVCNALARLRGPVDAYFDKVMVMADDERLRRNRLSLLARISSYFLRIADFSRITTQ